MAVAKAVAPTTEEVIDYPTPVLGETVYVDSNGETLAATISGVLSGLKDNDGNDIPDRINVRVHPDGFGGDVWMGCIPLFGTKPSEDDLSTLGFAPDGVAYMTLTGE